MKNNSISKIIISIFVFISIFSFFGQIKKVEAADPTVSLKLITAKQNLDKTWSWDFDINTVGVADGTRAVVVLYEPVGKEWVEISRDNRMIQRGYSNYQALSLKDNTWYFIKLVITLKTETSYTGKTGSISTTKIPPTITNLNPTSGAINTTITLTGTSFTGATEALINDKKLDSMVVISDTKIQGIIPADATDGKITIKTPNGEVTGLDVFTIVDGPAPITVDEIITAKKDYTLLAPIGGFVKAPDNVGEYFNIILKIAIGFCGVLAVIMIVIGGIQYMGDESIFGKTEAKKSITSAIFGLIIALGAYALLNTINPDLLGGGGVNIKQVSAAIEGDSNAPVGADSINASGIGINCPKTGGFDSLTATAKSFSGKMTYSQEIPKGSAGPNNTIKLDCSGFVNKVLQCVGFNTNKMGSSNTNINSGTAFLFNSKGEKVLSSTITPTSVNNIPLQVGDLVGWKPSDSKDGNGHVMIYIGGGKVADSHGPSQSKTKNDITGKAYGEFSTDYYKDRITYVLRTQKL